jgi:alkanesulfonate monooxygenase SsuD/methylene tetrahydromethanopterin reductase-like flavin-dependent oxidoreductase (luciferase family)
MPKDDALRGEQHMARVDFGLMLRVVDPEKSVSELLTFDRQCIQALTAGFSTLWMEDHLQWGTTDSLECFTTLSYMAATYPQFKVGTMVLGQSYRNPALLAKMMATLQALSGGRVILGLGAGWKEDEYHAYGYPFPPVKTRMDQLEEAAQIIRSMWCTQPATFEGQHYRIHNAYCAPLPSPMIPLLIGGGGEQRTLAIVARYADWWNFNSVSPEVYARKLSVLKQHCERIGRDPAAIKLTYLSTISVSENPREVVRSPEKHFVAGNAAEVTREIEQFAALGVTHLIFRVPDVPTLQRFIKSVVPNFL